MEYNYVTAHPALSTCNLIGQSRIIQLERFSANGTGDLGIHFPLTP